MSATAKLALLISACAFALYAWTAAPTLAWGGGDSAKLAIWAHRGEVGYAAESHPLYAVLARAFASFPLGGDLAWRLNLFSGFCAALAVGAMFLLCREITASDVGAACSAAALAVSHTFWLHAVLTEVYALHLLLLLSTLACLLRWDRTGRDRHLRLAAFFTGAGVANHILMTWALPGMAYFVWVRPHLPPTPCPTQPVAPIEVATRLPLSQWEREGETGVFSLRRGRVRSAFRLWAGVMVAGCVGASPLLYALARGASQNGLWDALQAALGLGGAGHVVLNGARLPLYLAYLFYQFPVAGFILGGVGLRALFRGNRRIALLLLLIGVPYLLFPVLWDFRDHYQFALSFYACFAVGIAPGALALRDRFPGRAAGPLALGLLVALPVITYASAPPVCRLLGIDPVRARTLPYRDNARYFLWPSKRGDDGARRYGTEALRAIAPNALIVGDYTPALVLTYFREVEGLRPDVEVRFTTSVPEQLRLIAEQIDRRPVYVATLESRTDLPAHLYLRRDALPEEYKVIPAAPVFRVVKKADPSPVPPPHLSLP